MYLFNGAYYTPIPALYALEYKLFYLSFICQKTRLSRLPGSRGSHWPTDMLKEDSIYYYESWPALVA